jgi:hypothetical protein
MNLIKLKTSFSKCYRVFSRESIILLIIIALLIYTVMRAKNLSFTHDESLGYYILHGIEHWHKTANNHLLNTFLMGASKLFFGESEFALRLPNLLAHFLFMIMGCFIFRKIDNPVLAICGFLLLNLNLFMVDFFSLARGYGLSLGFMMASIFFFIEASHSKSCKEQTTHDKHLVLSFFFSALAVLSNFTLLIYHLALFVAVIAEKLFDYGNESYPYKWKNFLTQNKDLLVGNFFYITLIVSWLIYLKNKRELYYGGNQAFWHDTVYSLVQSSLYSDQYSKSTIEVIAYAIAIVFLLTAGLAFYTSIINRKITTALRIVFISMICIFIVILQHYIVGTPYPMDRTALFFLPLFSIGVLFSIRNASCVFPEVWNKIVISILIVLCTVYCWHFVKNMNLTQTYAWKYDANTKTMMKGLHKEYMHGTIAPISLGIESIFEPTTNYYRLSKKLSWLAPTTRKWESHKAYDFYYGSEDKIKALKSGEEFFIIKRYPLSNTVLAKLKK